MLQTWGVGHFAKDCPSEEIKGEGKGGPPPGKQRWVKGGGKKGAGKGGGKTGNGWSPNNGKGGYQGVCWKCGLKGHKAYECRVAGKGISEVTETVGGEEEVSQVTEVSRVWTISQVMEDKGNLNNNRFEALAEAEGGEFPSLRREEAKVKRGKNPRAPKGRRVRTKLNTQEGVWIQGVQVGNSSTGMSLRFQVSDVKNPLIAVRRITEQGNTVSSGPQARGKGGMTFMGEIFRVTKLERPETRRLGS